MPHGPPSPPRREHRSRIHRRPHRRLCRQGGLKSRAKPADPSIPAAEIFGITQLAHRRLARPDHRLARPEGVGH